MAKKSKPSSSGSSKGGASKRRPSSVEPAPPALTLADLAADAANPRAIDEDSAAGLVESLDAFGDLAGITWNRRTGELVTGHQRVGVLAGLGEAVYRVIDAERELGALVIDGRQFPVRVVDWSIEKQRAANLAANNPRLQGKFTDGLDEYLAQVKGELEPDLWDDVGLALLFATPPELAAPEEWSVVVDCADEAQQAQLYAELRKRGHEVKLVTM